jgi:hypothetical protein
MRCIILSYRYFIYLMMYTIIIHQCHQHVLYLVLDTLAPTLRSKQHKSQPLPLEQYVG